MKATEPAADEALARIAEEAQARTGRLQLGILNLRALPPELCELDHLVTLELSSWHDLAENKTFDLTPLTRLASLRSLTLNGEAFRSIEGLVGVQSLERLFLAMSGVRDLGPLAALPAVRYLNCMSSKRIEWASMPHLPNLREFRAPRCDLEGCTFLDRIPHLTDLAIYGNPISDLSGLVECPGLETLDIDDTAAESFSPLGALDKLRTLFCSRVPARDWQVLRKMWESGPLERLLAIDVEWPSIPRELLSTALDDNCLPRLRAHFADVEAGAETHRQTKLMVIGNGRVGKTQLVRRLCQLPYDAKAPSTHGVMVTTVRLPPSTGGAADALHVWDFGGQDLYHGTHSLFMRIGSSALVAWNPASEAAGTHVHEGMRFRNEPLSYWLDFVKGSTGPATPLLIVQTQCDRSSDEVLIPPAEPELLDSFEHRKLLHTSAQRGRGFPALTEALQEAVDTLLSGQGPQVIGIGRARLIDRLAALRDADAARHEAQRQHRTLTLDEFKALCDEVGGISDPLMALDYLHRCGWVFHRPDMFNQAIVLDQAWALENIYAVFHRSHSFHHIRALRGRFTLGLLRDTVWRERSLTECRVLLDMMHSCEVCFEVRPGDADSGIEAEYIAPELLPDFALVAEGIEAERQKMPPDAPRAELRWDFGFLHSGHLRAALARVGRFAGEQAWYWREGFLGYEVRHRAWLEFGVTRSASGHGGSVRFMATGARPVELLAEVRTAMPHDWGNPIGAEELDRPLLRTPGQDVTNAEVASAAPPLEFAPSPRLDPRPCVAVSYAWGDKTPEGLQREALVDRLCVEADSRYAVRVWRDADVLKQGERLTRFMRDLAAHDRIVVVLSDKYLKSEYCMFELSEIWRRAQHDGEAFLSRVVVWALPDARIHTIADRLRVAVHWRDTFKALDALVRQEGPALLGEADMAKYKHMERYAADIGNMLALIADTLLPRNEELDFEPFLQRALGADLS